MKSKTLHIASFTLGLLLAIAIFSFIYINPSSESVLLDSMWSVLFIIVFILNLIISGYFIFKNSIRTRLSGIGSMVLLTSYLAFVVLIIYVFKSIAYGFVGLMLASIFAPIAGIIIEALYLIGVAIMIVAFFKRNSTQKIQECEMGHIH